MQDKTFLDNQRLVEFWNKAFILSKEDKEAYMEEPDGWRDLAPSEKLFHAAELLGSRNKVLDYGCGSAWAGIIAAKSGCRDITAVDVSESGIESAKFFAGLYDVEENMDIKTVPYDWLYSVPDKTYDGFFCSNVLDVVPSRIAYEIIRETARIVTDDATVIIGMNYYLSPEEAAERNMDLQNGNRVYVNGILRLVSRTDEEWTEILSPYFNVEKLEHFAWPGETSERRRLFWLKKK